MSIIKTNFRKMLEPGLRTAFGAAYTNEEYLAEAIESVQHVDPAVLRDLWFFKHGNNYVHDFDMYIDNLFYVAAARRLLHLETPLFVHDENGYCLYKDPDGNN